MSNPNFNLKESVSWRDVLKNMEEVLNIRSQRAFNCVWRVNRDRNHNYPENLEQDLKAAFSACENVFRQYKLLCALRKFLRYKPKTLERLGLTEFYYFYLVNKKNPRSEDLDTNTTGIDENDG